MSTNTKSTKPNKSTATAGSAPVDFLLKKENYYIIGSGILLLIIGYFLMSGGQQPADQFNADEIYSFTRITLSPIIIIIGYILIAFGIMFRAKKITEK
jgi:hypothetical protein